MTVLTERRTGFYCLFAGPAFQGSDAFYFACRTMARPLTASEPAAMAVAVRRAASCARTGTLRSAVAPLPSCLWVGPALDQWIGID